MSRSTAADLSLRVTRWIDKASLCPPGIGWAVLILGMSGRITPFDTHIVLGRKAANADDSIIRWVTSMLLLDYIPDQDFEIERFEFSQTLGILPFERLQHDSIVPRLITP